MKNLWRVTDGEWSDKAADGTPIPCWYTYTWLVQAETAQDAARAVVARIKREQVRDVELGWRSNIDLPEEVWCVPFKEFSNAMSLGSERHDIGEDFENMFDYDAVMAVRL